MRRLLPASAFVLLISSLPFLTGTVAGVWATKRLGRVEELRDVRIRDRVRRP